MTPLYRPQTGTDISSVSYDGLLNETLPSGLIFKTFNIADGAIG